MTKAIPFGTIITFAGPNYASLAPHWLLCDGSPLSASAYPALSKALGTAYGTDNQGNFYLPDLRGVFLRGVDGGAKVDVDASSRTAQINASVVGNGNTGDAVGSRQPDQFASHAHALGNDIGFYSSGDYPVYNRDISTSNMTGNSGGSETRPKNVYIYYLIYAG